MQFQNEIKDNEIIVFADVNLYSKDSIFKCLYWYGDKYHTSVSFANSNTYKVTVKPLTTTKLSENQFESIIIFINYKISFINSVSVHCPSTGIRLI